VLRLHFVPATERIAAQVACHRVFDRLWAGADAPLIRSRAYEYLQRITGMTVSEAHISNFDIGLCEAVAEKVIEDYPRLFGKPA